MTETRGPANPFFSLHGGWLAWLFSFIALWFLSEVDCASGLFSFSLLGLPAAQLLGLALTLVASFTALAAGFTAMQNSAASSDPEDERPFIVKAGGMLNGLFVIAILVTGLPYLLIGTCS